MASVARFHITYIDMPLGVLRTFQRGLTEEENSDFREHYLVPWGLGEHYPVPWGLREHYPVPWGLTLHRHQRGEACTLTCLLLPGPSHVACAVPPYTPGLDGLSLCNNGPKSVILFHEVLLPRVWSQ